MHNPIYEPKGLAREYAELALNIYTGCDHGCTYCFAPSVLHTTPINFLRDVRVRTGLMEALEKQCAIGDFDGKTLLLCFTCDPYSPATIKTGATRYVMSMLDQYKVNFTVLTKGGSRACSDFDLYNHGDSFGTTLTFYTPEESLLWEPSAALPSDRIIAIAKAKSMGIKTWVSLEPVISPKDALLFVEKLHHYVDLWKVGKWNYDARAKEIDWYRFGHEIEAMFQKYGCNYYIKKDLRNAMTKG